ncbi:MAG: nucleoside deaminase [Nodosilinea sp.]
MNPEAFMQLAIEAARQSETPFGAVIVKDGQVVERAGNTVKPDSDPTGHAEVNVMRKLTRRLGSARLEGDYILYTTCEPCAMCAATCFWAGITHIVYGAGSEDFPDSNPNQINITCADVLKHAPQDFKVEGGLLRDECKQLHADFPL